MERKNYFLYTISSLTALLLLKALCLHLVDLNLWVDEAQYWAWAKTPALGYYSKPPFVAWLIGITTHIFGDTLFGVRIGALTLHYFAALFIFLIASSLYDERTGFLSALVYFTLPGVVLSTTFISTDAPLMFFWTASFFFLIRASDPTQRYKTLTWVLYGLFLGLGLLSKYTIAVFVFMSFYYFFRTRKGKEIFKPGFWFANVLAFLIFIPNLYWNYKNNFVSFRHTEENVVTGNIGGGVKLLQMLEFSGSQFAVFGAALAFFIIIALRSEDDEKLKQYKKLLLLFSLPLLAIAIVISFMSGAQAHWAAPAYVTATIFTVAYLVRHDRRKWLRIILISNMVIFILCLNIKIPSSLVAFKKDPLARVNNWYITVQPLEAALKLYPNALLVSDERKIITPLMYALRNADGDPKIVYKWNPTNAVHDHFDLTQSFHDDSETPVLFITRNDSIIEQLNDIYFNNDVLLSPSEGNRFYIYLLQGQRDRLTAKQPAAIDKANNKASKKK